MEMNKCFFLFFCFLIETNDGKRSFVFLNLQHAQWWCGWKQMMSTAWLNQSGISVIEKRVWSVIRFGMLNWWWINRCFFLSDKGKEASDRRHFFLLTAFCWSKKNGSDFFSDVISLVSLCLPLVQHYFLCSDTMKCERSVFFTSSVTGFRSVRQ